MFWGFFDYVRKLSFQSMNETVNAKKYQDILDKSGLAENGELIGESEFLFQHDNTRTGY